jgi:D-aminoacyl-tRNA deacylase
MRAVIQRVKKASVRVKNETLGSIERGLLVYLGVSKHDDLGDISYIADKILNLRIFKDDNDKMNLSVLDVKGDVMVISQFTLYGDTRKGRRPSYNDAADPQNAEDFYNKFILYIAENYKKPATGKFQASMEVEYINQGPVTILVDSDKKF